MKKKNGKITKYEAYELNCIDRYPKIRNRIKYTYYIVPTESEYRNSKPKFEGLPKQWLRKLANSKSAKVVRFFLDYLSPRSSCILLQWPLHGR